MSNLENIVNKILEDAQIEADRIMEETTKVNKEVIDLKIKEANDRKHRIIEKAKADASMMKDRIISNAELKVRDEKLSAKQEVLNRVFELSKQRLKSLDEDEYIKFLNNNLKTIDLKGGEMLIVPEKMKSKVKSQNLSLKVLEDEVVESGFILKSHDISMNFTFDSLVDFLREEIETEIAEDLFKE